MQLIFYGQMVFGILFVIRTHQIFRARALISAVTVTKTGTAFVFACLLIGFFATQNVFLRAGMLSLNLFGSVIALFLLEWREIDALKREIPLFLDRWILNLRLGNASLSAREFALKAHSLAFQRLMRPVFSVGSPRERHVILSRMVMREMEKLTQEPHSALARLENLREGLRKSADFRRKSGQALRQTAIQSVVLLVLLLALMLFTFHRYGWKRAGDLVLISGGLALTGVLIMYLLSRKTKWKI